MTYPTFSKILLDADQLCYSVGYASQGEPWEACQAGLEAALGKIKLECRCDNLEVYIKGEGNYRDAIAPYYKSHRKSDKPDHYEGIRDYLITDYKAILVNGKEADDAVSMELYEDWKEHGELGTLIVSSVDKDLKNTPGWHHNPKSGEVVYYDDRQATRHFWYQMLMGDTADNIPGLGGLSPEIFDIYGIKKTKGLGAATAKRLMSKTHTAEEAELLVLFLYMYRHDLDFFMEQAKLLWMSREAVGDFAVKEELLLEASKYVENHTFPYSRPGWDSEDSDRLRSGDGESDYSDKSGDTLRIKPAASM